MKLEFTREFNDQKAQLIVKGEIDVSNAPELRETIHEILDGTCESLLIDIAQVSYIDSTGIGVLVGAKHRAAEDSVAFEVLNPQPNVLRVLTLLGMVDDLNVQMK